MILDEIKSIDKECYMNTFGDRTPVCFEKGEGIYLYSADGEKYCDFMGGIAVNALGHAHPIMTEALCDQAKKLLHVSNLYYNRNQVYLAQKITENSCADKVFFSNSGAEANEGALKLARMYFHKKGEDRIKFVTLKNSFHGRTLATVAATGQEKYQKPYRPLMSEFVHVTANDVDELKAAVTDDTCAVILELIQGESGVYPLSFEFVNCAKELCEKTGALLIIDEIQTGMGRTGKLFAYQHYNIEPDIFTLAKALGGGVPIGAVCCKDSCAAFTPGDHGTTFGGNPLVCRAGLAVFEAFEKENLVENSRNVGEYFINLLKEIDTDKIKEVRGKGLMIGIELNVDAKTVNANLLSKGYLCGVAGNTLRVLPPLIVTKEQVTEFVEVLKNILMGR